MNLNRPMTYCMLAILGSTTLGCNNSKNTANTDNKIETNSATNTSLNDARLNDTPSTEKSTETPAPMSSPTTAKKDTIESIATDIKNHAHHDAIAQSLYKTIRPHVHVTRSNLSEVEIDTATKKYISETYAPVMIENFSQIHTSMKQQKQRFSDCANPVAFDPEADLKQAFCLDENETGATVIHLTGYGTAPLKESIRFVFDKSNDGIKMVDIQLSNAEQTSYFVEGVSN